MSRKNHLHIYVDKFRGATPSTSVEVKFPSFIVRRRNEQGEKMSASTLRGIALMYLHYSHQYIIGFPL